jgi:hypothetical protein
VIHTKEDKQIEILHLQIRLAKLTWEHSACASSSQMTLNPFEEVSTLSSSMSCPSHFSSHSFIDNNLMTSDDYCLPNSEAPDIAVGWSETFNFAA